MDEKKDKFDYGVVDNKTVSDHIDEGFANAWINQTIVIITIEIGQEKEVSEETSFFLVYGFDKTWIFILAFKFYNFIFSILSKWHFSIFFENLWKITLISIMSSHCNFYYS